MKKSEFQFSNPVLENITFKMNKDFSPVDEGPINMPITCKVNTNKSDKDNEAIVQLKVSIGSNDGTKPFYVEAVESAVFRWKDETDNVDNLLSINAPALLLGYLRPTIAVITSASPFNSYDIPFINFSESSKE